MPRTPINSPKYLRLTSRISTLESRVHRLESTLEQGLDLLHYLKQNSPSSMNVPINVIMVILCNPIQSHVNIQKYLTYSESRTALKRLASGNMNLTSYNRNPFGNNKGITVNSLIILNSFLHYVCAESSELQTGSRLFPVRFVFFYQFFVGKVYQMTEGRQLQTQDDQSETLTQDAPIETCGSVEQSSFSQSSAPLVQITSPTKVPMLARELFFKKFLTQAGIENMNSYLRGQCELNDSSPISADV